VGVWVWVWGGGGGGVHSPTTTTHEQTKQTKPNKTKQNKTTKIHKQEVLCLHEVETLLRFLSDEDFAKVRPEFLKHTKKMTIFSCISKRRAPQLHGTCPCPLAVTRSESRARDLLLLFTPPPGIHTKHPTYTYS
jgi:hypothetical protein